MTNKFWDISLNCDKISGIDSIGLDKLWVRGLANGRHRFRYTEKFGQAIGSVISRADNNATEAEKELVADAARLYVTTENDEVEWKEETSGESKSEIKVSKLYEEGFLDDRGGNNEDGNKLGGEVVVTRTGSPESGYQYEYDAS